MLPELLKIRDYEIAQTTPACLGEDTNLFYSESFKDHQEALKFCARCAVQSQCLDYAMNKPEIYGVWGGRTAIQRTLLRKTSSIRY